MKTPSLWYVGERRVEVREVDIPATGSRDVLVEVEACGICTWDLFIFSGGFQDHAPFPFYFGHEGVGTVLEVGRDVEGFAPGDFVALRQADDITAIGAGHMAGHAVVPQHKVIPLPRGNLSAAGWMIEPVACCVHAIDRARVQCGDRVALVGCGFMGAILLQGLLTTPAAEVAVFDTKPEHLELARSYPHAGQLTTHDARGLLDGGGSDLDGTFDTVIEAAAAESGFHVANRLVRQAGRFIVFSWHHDPFTGDLGRWHELGVTVENVSPPAHPNFDECFCQSIPLMASGSIDVGGLVTHEVSPSEAQAVYEMGLAKTDGYLKGVVRWK